MGLFSKKKLMKLILKENIYLKGSLIRKAK